MRVTSIPRPTALLLGAVTLLGAALVPSPQAQAAGGRHNLMVRSTSEVHSIAVAIVRSGYTCVTLPPRGSEYSAWHSTNLSFADGTVLRVNLYTGNRCDGTYWGGRRVTVPKDSLVNFWLDLSGKG